ncbi:receptor-type tyrosine-protein phosphatase eta-like [Fukomys damarensis]|uniref:receptor-type tyrosine-protein phosphatase eta-like n=1 Tax=Fukomys damarensis TaxID=885580 RepID=UPI00053F9D61|nr:receptor-type tyrosine-protein phosphatase eta-like [Fukomys damarensis]
MTNVNTTAMPWGSDGQVILPSVSVPAGAGEAGQSGPMPGTSASPATLAPTPSETEGTLQTADSPAQGVVSGFEVHPTSPTSVVLTWKKENPSASDWYRIEEETSNTAVSTQQTWYNVTGLRPATTYTFSISLGRGNKTWGKPTSKNVTTEPLPVWGLRVAFMGRTQVVLTWGSDSSTASCRLLLESIGSQQMLTSIPDLRPGFQRVILSLPGSDEAQSEPPVTPSGSGAGGIVSSTPIPAYWSLEHTGLDSDLETRDTEVLIAGLQPDAHYSAAVYPRAADSTEGQPRGVEFQTNSEQVFDIRAVNVSATSLGLAWKMRHSGSSSAYTYGVHVAGDAESFNLTTQEPCADVAELSSSTLYRITVHPLLRGAVGTPGFLQVYTREFAAASCPSCVVASQVPGAPYPSGRGTEEQLPLPTRPAAL